MDGVNKTLYIPLYGKAYVSGRGLFLRDEKAEQIWKTVSFPLKGKAASKWLAYNMAMRAAVFDRWLEEKMAGMPDAVILHIGCGLDSRCSRVGTGGHLWFDVDFPEVIRERSRYYDETENYRLLAADVRQTGWMEAIPAGKPVILVMEGVSMYLRIPELCRLLTDLKERFGRICILMDVYTVFAAKVTKYQNPINEVGVTQVYGMDSPEEVTETGAVRFVREHELTPEDLICRLPRREQLFFRRMFAGRLAKKIYRLYEYET